MKYGLSVVMALFVAFFTASIASANENITYYEQKTHGDWEYVLATDFEDDMFCGAHTYWPNGGRLSYRFYPSLEDERLVFYWPAGSIVTQNVTTIPVTFDFYSNNNKLRSLELVGKTSPSGLWVIPGYEFAEAWIGSGWMRVTMGPMVVDVSLRGTMALTDDLLDCVDAVFETQSQPGRNISL